MKEQLLYIIRPNKIVEQIFEYICVKEYFFLYKSFQFTLILTGKLQQIGSRWIILMWVKPFIQNHYV